MRDNDPIQGLGLECPSGSTFHVCKNDPNRFIGCCGVNPCGARKGLCPDQHLYAASFDKAYEEHIPSQACTNDNVDVAWHVCSWSTSCFIGCCAVDPCSGGCPSRELRAAKLSDNSKNAEVFLGEGYDYPPEPSSTPSPSWNPATSTIVSSATAITTAAVSSFLTSYTLGTTSEADTSSVELAAPSHKSSGHSKDDFCLSKGAFIGIVIIIIFLAISSVCLFLQCLIQRRRGEGFRCPTHIWDSTLSMIMNKSKEQRSSPVQTHQSETPGTLDKSTHSKVQPIIQLDKSHHNRINHPYIASWEQKKPEVAQQNGYLQVSPLAMSSRSPSPKNDDDMSKFLDPSELPSVISDKNPDLRFSFELEGSPVPAPPVITAPPPSANPPNIQNDTGSPHDSLSYVLREMRVTNGYASDRSSDASKIGTDSNGGVRLSTQVLSSTVRGSGIANPSQ